MPYGGQVVRDGADIGVHPENLLDDDDADPLPEAGLAR